MPRPAVLVVSQIAGLRAAFEARGLAGPWIRWTETGEDPALQLQSCDVLVGEPALLAPLVASAPRLAWLQSTFAGCNQLLDVPRRDYTVTRLAGCFGPDMGEYCTLHILALERQYEEQRRMQSRAEWAASRASAGFTYRRLSSLTLGVLGLGDIGSEIARVAHHGLRMKVIGCRRDPAPRDTDASAGVSRVLGMDGLAELFASADYIVSVLPSTPATRGLIDGSVLSAAASSRRDGAQPPTKPPVLINVGRGDVIGESTALEALERGWLGHFVSDVFAPEPLRAESPLWAHPKATVTSHNSAETQPEDVAAAFADNLERFERGGVEALREGGATFDWEAGY